MKNRYFLLILVLWAAHVTQPAFGQISHVQTTTFYDGHSRTSISMNFSSSSTTGNLIVVHLSWDNTASNVSSVTDNRGNTYQSVSAAKNWNSTFRSQLYYAYDITGGSITITATLSAASTSYVQIYMSEYSGVDILSPLDQHSNATGSSTAVSSGFKTTTTTNELIYGVSIGSSGLLTKGTGYTARSTANQNVVEDKIVATAGSYNAAFTSASGNWVAEMAAFKPHVLLPVSISGLEALVTKDRAVKVDWTTSFESNSSYFELQRSRNGSDWTRVHTLPAAGTSSVATHYTTIDSMPYTGVSYYRLLQADLDGRTTYSQVMTVHIDASSVEAVRMYPNPAVSYITIEGGRSDLQTIYVANYAGQWMNDKVRIHQDGEGKVTLDLSILPKGLYILKTKNSSTPFYKQ